MFLQRCWSSADARPLSEEIVEFTEEELAGTGTSESQHLARRDMFQGPVIFV